MSRAGFLKGLHRIGFLSASLRVWQRLSYGLAVSHNSILTILRNPRGHNGQLFTVLLVQNPLQSRVAIAWKDNSGSSHIEAEVLDAYKDPYFKYPYHRGSRRRGLQYRPKTMGSLERTPNNKEHLVSRPATESKKRGLNLCCAMLSCIIVYSVVWYYSIVCCIITAHKQLEYGFEWKLQ